MKPQEFQKELLFGLENLQKVKNDIDVFRQYAAPPQMRNSALAYASMGYFNALEHLMIRVLKFRQIALPTGSASHQMILQAFQNESLKLDLHFPAFDAIKRLLGLCHVANKIYGFLIDPDKLSEIVAVIIEYHEVFCDLFDQIISRSVQSQASSSKIS